MIVDHAALTVGRTLVELCRQGQHARAVDELYADDAQHVEAAECGPDMPRVTTGKEAIRKSAQQWETNMQVHHEETKGPYPHGEDRFAVWMSADVTPKEGPMAGRRHQIEEVCLYSLREGKIAKAEFFYDMSQYAEMAGG